MDFCCIISVEGINTILKFFKQIIKKGINRLGFEVVRINQVPQHTFMGLKQLPIKTIIDVGANIGPFAQMVLNIFPEAHIHCFEPLPEVYRELHEFADKSGNRVSAYNLALGENEGTVTMHHHVNHHYSSSLLQTTKYVEDLFPKTENQIAVSVKQTTLDTWMGNARNINPDILIKIDVQGYEDRVIRGGCSLFKKAKACILEINLADLYHGQASFRDIFLLLDELGYGYSGNLAQEYNNDGQVVYIDALFLKGN